MWSSGICSENTSSNHIHGVSACQLSTGHSSTNHQRVQHPATLEGPATRLACAPEIIDLASS